jgi:hypothetical protein
VITDDRAWLGPRATRRELEQWRFGLPFGASQQQRPIEPEQQHRFPRRGRRRSLESAQDGAGGPAKKRKAKKRGPAQRQTDR